MTAKQTQDWNPETYARFRGFRLRPALDLLAQVGPLPRGDIIDLGCGDGAVAPALRAIWPKFERTLIGVDTSRSMLGAAERLHTDTGDALYDGLSQADIALWTANDAPALLFSNAALHWVPDHAAILPRLVAMLAPGGVLAVQMPRQFDAPSHQLLTQVANALFPGRIDTTPPPVAPPITYQRMLAPLGDVTVWETDYIQRLPPVLAPIETGHPVRHFTQSTAMRPILAALNLVEADQFIATYDQHLLIPYPLEYDGSVLFPFRRLFITLRKTDTA